MKEEREKNLQQIKMWEEIPPKVWGDIRVHLHLCGDLLIWTMFSKNCELLGKCRTMTESGGCPVPLYSEVTVWVLVLCLWVFMPQVLMGLKRNLNKKQKCKTISANKIKQITKKNKVHASSTNSLCKGNSKQTLFEKHVAPGYLHHKAFWVNNDVY